MAKSAYRFGDRTIAQLANQNYYTARAYYHYRLWRQDRRFPNLPLLIYQMGSVGSSSVTQSLKSIELDYNIYHLHFLKPELIDEYEKKRKPTLRSQKGAGGLRHIWQYQYLYRLLRGSSNARIWKIVTLVRDPIARNISGFFENIEIIPGRSEEERIYKSSEHDFEVKIRGNDPSELIQLFFERFDHNSPANYFDREFKGVLNIDLYAREFPGLKQYKIYHENIADILLIKLEYLDSCFAEAFKDFLGLENLKLLKANVGEDKPSAGMYRRFKEQIKFPQSYLESIYTTKFMRHFYSESEINQFKNKWSHKAGF
jgi:hypothetical protein